MSYPRGSGVPHRGPVLEIYADTNALTVACESCGAGVDEYCVLTGNSKTYKKHLPCLSRLKAAERQVS